MQKTVGLFVIGLVVGLWAFALLGDGVLQNTGGTTTSGSALSDTNTPSLNGTNTFSGTNSFSSQILAANGASGAPSIAFSGSKVSGFYRVNSTTIGFSDQAVTRFGFTGGNLVARNDSKLGWSSDTTVTTAADLFLGRGAAGAGDLRSGDSDAAPPVSQISSVQNVPGGTANTAGADRSFYGSIGTGTGAGGAIVFKTAPARTSASTVNPLVTAVTIAGSGQVSVGGVFIATNGFTSYTNSLGVNSFTFPNTTVNWTNPVHVAIEVYIDNTAVTGTVFKKNGVQIFGGLSTDITIGLRDGEYFSETFTVGTPSGTWSVYP